MATDIQDERKAFNRYIDEQCGGTLNGHTLEEALAEFREYQRQLEQLREKLRLSEESAKRDGTHELSEERLDKLCDTWEQELRDEGAIK